jgi:hypothetical protein
MEPDQIRGRVIPVEDFGLREHDKEVTTAWHGSEWHTKYSGRCAIVTFGAAYGKLLPEVEACISKYLLPKFLTFKERSLASTAVYRPGKTMDLSDPWVGYSHAAIGLAWHESDASRALVRLAGPLDICRAAKCEWCGKFVRYHASCDVLRTHRKRCRTAPPAEAWE